MDRKRKREEILDYFKDSLQPGDRVMHVAKAKIGSPVLVYDVEVE